MEENLVTLDIGDSWIVILNFIGKKKSFDGHVNMRSTPIIVSRGEIMLQTDVVANHVFGKKQINLGNKRKTREEFLIVWKKRNIFFTLPY